MTIRHLKIFIEVARTGKMSLAAQRLFISQPTVSQAIRELEDHYSQKLFERLSKKLYITSFGKELFSYATKVVEQFDNLEKTMNDNLHIENLRIGASVTVGTCLLSKILKEFHNLAPRVNTYAYVNNTTMVEKKLLESDLDIAIVEGEIHSQDLVPTPVIDDYLVLLCNNNHPLSKKEKITLYDLQNQRFAMREDGSGTREFFEQILHKYKIQIQLAYEASSTDTIRRAILDDDCLSLLSIHTFEEDIICGKIHIMKTDLNPLKRSFKLVHHKDKIMTPSIITLKEILKKYKTSDFMKDLLIKK
ncbi:MAG: LysR family transcriptional regulator [Terrisporobacter othiniensis]|uniref:LysR family transcriptional regulator n=1 Tax=Terrisporobacter petrolearius TaxID=1460447 RepID=UPI0008ED0862|nr:LysR family transcriptional regulator [Terrisporobacter petrolearius]MBN9648214.1 LysR family transcriptional regulator [Terrisporobacter glycolicus]MDU4861482.1 LysR family transcriptional regulator [Terrisporobacter othiniensis]MDU6995101.1 LysR family transcriptional regulator [Terrisporobacter othiniensis]SFJ49567.1 DNA-binding transcriptional regulator, LysR family [Terrisporobacter glycolicus]